MQLCQMDDQTISEQIDELRLREEQQSQMIDENFDKVIEYLRSQKEQMKKQFKEKSEIMMQRQ